MMQYRPRAAGSGISRRAGPGFLERLRIAMSVKPRAMCCPRVGCYPRPQFCYPGPPGVTLPQCLGLSVRVLDNDNSAPNSKQNPAFLFKFLSGESPGLSAQGGAHYAAAKHKAENRARPGGSIPGSIPWPESRSLPWPGGGQGARWSDWWRSQFSSPTPIREWAAQELTTGRLLPWFAVAYGTGVVLY